MNPTNEINWWIDHTGSTHIVGNTVRPAQETLAIGKVYPDSKSGVITHLNNKPANLALISQELLDVLHNRFPGTRWWVKDINAVSVPRHQTAS
jgi:hypothetical protein